MNGPSDLIKFVQQLRARRDEFAFNDVVINEPPPPETTAGYRRQLEICPPPHWASSTAIVEDAHVLISQAITNYLEDPYPDYMLLIKAMPGTGKTFMAVAAAEELITTKARIAYAGPRHDFFLQVMAFAKKPQAWYEWLPRQIGGDDDDHPETCRYAYAITNWMNKGYTALDFCSGVCGWSYIGKQCPYHAQQHLSNPIMFIQHQHVCLGHPLEFGAVIGDESPITAFMHCWEIPARFIVPKGINVAWPITDILYRLLMIADNSRHMEGEELIDFCGGSDVVLNACKSLDIIGDVQALAPDIHSATDVEEAPYFHLIDLASLLYREATAVSEGRKYPHRLLIHNGKLMMLLRHSASAKLPPHLIWLDATANVRIYEAIFKRQTRIIDISPRLQGYIYQVLDRSNGKSSLISKQGNVTEKTKQLETQIKAIIKNYKYKQPALISFQKVIDNIDLESLEIYRAAHFYAARGTNELEGCDAIIVAGTPQPSLIEIAKLAKMIFFERDLAFTYTFSDKPVKYRYVDDNGMGRQYPVSGFWDDINLQEILNVMRQDEILQAAHRGRPIIHPIDIWLLTNIPIDGLPPTQLITIRELLCAPLNVNAFSFARVKDWAIVFYQENGYMSRKAMIEILGINRETATKYINELIKSGEWEIDTIVPVGAGRPQKTIKLK